MTRRSILAALCVTALFLPATSCITITTNPDDGGGGGPVTPTAVTVRLVNSSPGQAVDPQLYATSEAISDVNTQLFIPANSQAAGIGEFGTSLITPGQTAELSIPCPNALILATQGGSFVNRDGTIAGAGTQYILSQGSQFQCGSTITFTYTPAGSGFATGLAITPPGG